MKLTKLRLFAAITLVLAVVGSTWLSFIDEPQPSLSDELAMTVIPQQQTTQVASVLNQHNKQSINLPSVGVHELTTDINASDTVQDLDTHQTPWQPERQAMDSFSQSLTIDDPRAPPINHSEPQPPVDQDILDDPQLYAEHEAAQHRQMLSRYLQQAQNKQQQLTSLIAKGRSMGVDERKLAEGLQKLAALKHGIEVAKKALRD